MSITLIRYRTHADRSDENQRRIERVFEELHAAAPPGVRYAALRQPDGTFVHLVATTPEAADTLPSLAAFRAFQDGIRDRCIEPPQRGAVTIVGNRGMLAP